MSEAGANSLLKIARVLKSNGTDGEILMGFREVYPEDIDLLPRENHPDEDFPDDDELMEDDAADQGDRGRLTMQKVMKNVKYNEADSDDMDELSDSLFNDDDDMEYSFISSTRRK